MSEPIAIVGIGCLFPDAETPAQYWQNLLDMRDSCSVLTKDQLGVSPEMYYDDRAGQPDKICYNNNGHVRDFIFDSQGYKLPADYLNSLDPLFKWTLYAAGEAAKDAGLVKDDGRSCGLVLGNIGMPTHAGKRMMSSFYADILEPHVRELLGDERFRFKSQWQAETTDEINLSTASRNVLLAADALGLSGPTYALDAACSSALYAINTASNYLRAGHADVMLAGAVCHADHVYLNHGFNVLQAFPGLGQASVPLDRRSAGLKAGEGAGVVALKLLSVARRDGDRIHGVIEGLGLSNDGGAKHILVPDVSGQLLALTRAYGEERPDIDYLECHATGTPVGDQVELNTVEQFFSVADSLPLIGANKGNIGHLLTASGMASLIKVLLCIKNNTIPGTIGVGQMVATRAGKLGIEQVVRDATPWPKRGSRKRAGINAFGFGGVNGHMIVAEDATTDTIVPTAVKPDSWDGQIAIVGMSVAAGRTTKLADFNTAISDAEVLMEPLPRTRWSGVEGRTDLLQRYGLKEPPEGAYIESFEFDCKRFKLPPNVTGIHLLSHMSLMQLAAGAYYDAGYDVTEPKRNIAVIVASDDDYLCYRYQARNEMAWQLRDSLLQCGIALTETEVLELESVVKNSLFPEPYAEGITGGIGNVVASRISASLKLNGPAFTLCSQENSVFRAIEVANLLLRYERVDAVIVGSGSFDGGLENVLFANVNDPVDTSGCCFSYDSESNGKRVGEGGGVIVLKRKCDALADKDRIYSIISASCIERDAATVERADLSSMAPQAPTIEYAARQCLEKAGVSADCVDYIEASASGHRDHDGPEIDALRAVYGSSGHKTVLGTVKANYGHLGAASGMLSIIKTALCLHNQYLPGTPGWDDTRRSKRPLGSMQPLSSSHQWSHSAETEGRTSATGRFAVVNSIGSDRTCCHVLMSESIGVTQIEKSDIDKDELRKNALLKTIYVGRERTIAEYVMDKQGLSVGFAASRIPMFEQRDTVKIIDAKVNELPDVSLDKMSFLQDALETMRLRELERSIATHCQYISFEGRCARLLTGMLSLDALVSSDEIVSDGAIEPTQAIEQRSTNAISAQPTPAVFEREDLEELTDGLVGNVLGERYSEADNYSIRTRMPSPPYLFVSRITSLNAQYGKLEPCEIEFEFDMPRDSWFIFHELVPAFVTLEASHAMIVAFTVIGCDQLFKGKLKYRAVDSKTTIYSEMPKASETLKGRVAITSFMRIGSTVLINYEYDGYVGQRHCFKLTATSGFFSAKDIAKSKRVNTQKYFEQTSVSTRVALPLVCNKNKFSDAELACVQQGDLESVFGPGYGNVRSPALCVPSARMLDRIPHLDPTGGAWGLGQIIGEFDVEPEHWAFRAHFKNDPVLPGTLIVEGAEQLVRFYLYYIGLHTLKGLEPVVIDSHTYSAKFWGEVICQSAPLRYRITVKKMDARYTDSNELAELTILFVSETLYDNEVIGVCDNLGSRFVRGDEKTAVSRTEIAVA